MPSRWVDPRKRCAQVGGLPDGLGRVRHETGVFMIMQAMPVSPRSSMFFRWSKAWSGVAALKIGRGMMIEPIPVGHAWRLSIWDGPLSARCRSAHHWVACPMGSSRCTPPSLSLLLLQCVPPSMAMGLKLTKPVFSPRSCWLCPPSRGGWQWPSLGYWSLGVVYGIPLVWHLGPALCWLPDLHRCGLAAALGLHLVPVPSR